MVSGRLDDVLLPVGAASISFGKGSGKGRRCSVGKSNR